MQSFQGHTSAVRSVAFAPACPEGMDCPFGNEKMVLVASIPDFDDGSPGRIGQYFRPWAFMEQKVGRYSIGALKAAGLEYEVEEFYEMMERTKNHLWQFKQR